MLAPLDAASMPERVLARRLSLAVAYELWLESWETALTAVATATQSGTLGLNESAAHKAVIAAEREVVSKQFKLLLGHHLDDVAKLFGDGELVV